MAAKGMVFSPDFADNQLNQVSEPTQKLFFLWPLNAISRGINPSRPNHWKVIQGISIHQCLTEPIKNENYKFRYGRIKSTNTCGVGVLFC